MYYDTPTTVAVGSGPGLSSLWFIHARLFSFIITWPELKSLWNPYSWVRVRYFHSVVQKIPQGLYWWKWWKLGRLIYWMAFIHLSDQLALFWWDTIKLLHWLSYIRGWDQGWQYVQWYFENFSIDLNLYSLSINSEEKLRTIIDMMWLEQTPFLMPDSCGNNTTS